jgi:4'-phosphopantetheinyl transferase
MVSGAHVLVASQASMWAHAQPLEAGWGTQSEQARMAAMQHPARRQEFVACRHALRSLLARTTSTALDHWALDAPEGNAPRLNAQRHGADAAASTHLTLSHSGHYLACALAAQPVGVDLEVENLRSSRRDVLALAAIACSDDEAQRLQAAGCERTQRQMFVQWWSLKEAYFKCIGTGVDLSSIRHIECRPAVDKVAGTLAHGRSWSGKTALGQDVALSLCSLDHNTRSSAILDGNGMVWRGQDDWALVAC